MHVPRGFFLSNEDTLIVSACTSHKAQRHSNNAAHAVKNDTQVYYFNLSGTY